MIYLRVPDYFNVIIDMRTGLLRPNSSSERFGDARRKERNEVARAKREGMLYLDGKERKEAL